jgi:N-acetyl-alpha-D-glucosaminyl L-malate synthase BshA
LAQKNERIVTHISNFRPLKRITDVISIFQEVKHHLKAKLFMVGDGPEKERAERYVEKIGLSDDVVFFGNSNEIEKVLCYSDLFLLPSEKESFGLSALEAMAHGVPVVSSNAGGISEVNKHGFSGFLSPVGDTENMALNAIHILEDTNRLNQFKKQATKQAQLFDIKEAILIYERIYTEAIASIQY